MRITQIVKKVKKKYGVNVSAKETSQSIILEGETCDYKQLVNIGKEFVDRKSGKHVVNNIVFTCAPHETIYQPNLTDNALDGKKVDVLVIGGGVIGCAVLRELTRYNLSCLLVEKHSDVAHGASGANDGMVHAGIDLHSGYLKTYYGPKGNSMFDRVTKELDVPFVRSGQYVIFANRLIQLFGRTYVSRSKKHNIPGVRMLNKKEIDAIEPNTRSWAVGALYAPTTGAVSPYKLTIAYAENACQNGAIVSFDTIVTDIVRNGDEIIKVTTNRGEIIPKVVINCAGVFADKIAEMAGDKFYSIHPRKGTDLIMDGKVSNQIAHNSISRAPTLKMLMGENRNTKGGGIVVTVDGNILIGPDAVETPLCEDISTTAENIKKVIAKQQNITDGLRQSDVIAYFSGVRAANYEEDFIIEPSKKVRNFVHAACIQSPGLTASPAIGEDVAKMAVDILKKQQIVEYNSNFNPIRKDIPHLKKMSDKERDLLIKSNADYGKILCRCEEVSLGEIKDAIHSNPPALTVDAVKRRVRAGMGRCQGGFCQPLVMQTLAEELNIDETQVRKGDIGSNLAVGYNKDIYIEQ